MGLWRERIVVRMWDDSKSVFIIIVVYHDKKLQNSATEKRHEGK